ncbi:MAG: hypothetical protein A4E73_03398 [Syntrophaceae bacterium PtaU1.Bin231]|nr:MAG: hypothetical protein A4E73_03398 [Syntrophaceae bacterium PtaU1.Bin231]
MVNETDQGGMRIPDKCEGVTTTRADRGQGIDRCAGILRILLLASRSCPYERRQDLRGILLDSYC